MKIILLLLSVSLANCTTTKLVYVPCEPYDFQYTTPTPEQVIRVHIDDVQLYEAYIDSLRSKPILHNEQLDDYFKDFKK